MKSIQLSALFTLTCASAFATPRTSENFGYAITAEVIDFGGQTVTSENNVYSITGSIGPVTGVSESSDPVPSVARHGFIGQLYERVGLGMLASDFYPSELATTQLLAVHTNDDGTNDPIPGEDVAWSVLNGPIGEISLSGLATAAAVIEDSEAVVSGTVFGTPLELTLYVLDSLPDNFGMYAGDGLDDAWQKLHFGLNNPLAGPLLDPDGDSQNNRFEFIAGLVPTDPLSRFLFSIEPVPGEPTHKELKFSPVWPDRNYTVKSNTTLTGGIWEPLGSEADDNGQPERKVTDLDASQPEKFYKVEITKP